MTLLDPTSIARPAIDFKKAGFGSYSLVIENQKWVAIEIFMFPEAWGAPWRHPQGCLYPLEAGASF